MRRLAFAVLAFALLAGAARASGRDGVLPTRGETATPAPHAGDLLAEASRWLGQGNPTPFHEAWCRDFVNMVLERAGHPLADRSHLALRALRLGPRVRAPRPGDLAILPGHVTFFAGWDGEDAFLGLGGNQRNRVRVSRFARRAVIAFVRPA